MQLVDYSQGSAEWLGWRLGRITGTDAIIIAAGKGLIQKKPAWVKPLQWLWEVKLGKRSGIIPDNIALRQGRMLEPVARRLYEQVYEPMSPVCVEGEGDFSFMGASLDGVSFGMDVILEIKVPSEDVAKQVDFGLIPEYYVPQLAHQAMCMWGHPDQWKNTEIHFGAYSIEQRRLMLAKKPALRLAEFAKRLLPELRSFWASIDQSELPCGMDWAIAAQQYIVANEQKKAAEAEMALVKERLVSLMGGLPRKDGAGISVTTSEKKGSIDYGAYVRALNIDDSELEPFRKKDTTTTAIHILS